MEHLTVKQCRNVGKGFHIRLTNEKGEDVHFIMPMLDQCKSEESYLKHKLRLRLLLDKLDFEYPDEEFMLDTADLIGLEGDFEVDEVFKAHPYGNYGYIKEIKLEYTTSFGTSQKL